MSSSRSTPIPTPRPIVSFMKIDERTTACIELAALDAFVGPGFGGRFVGGSVADICVRLEDACAVDVEMNGAMTEAKVGLTECYNQHYQYGNGYKK